MGLGSAQAWAAADMTSAEKNSRAPGRARFEVDVAMAELAGVSSGCGVEGANDMDDIGEAIMVDRNESDAEDAGDNADVGVDGRRTKNEERRSTSKMTLTRIG